MTLFAHLLVIRDGVRSPETATYRCTSTSTICARGQCLLARGISSTREVSRTRGTRRDEEPPRCPSYGTLFFTHRQRHGDAPDLGAGVWGKASSTRFHAPKLPPARGGEREWSCLSLHRVVVLALFPRLLPRNANVPHSPSHAKGRESGHASPCISQTTRPWSIGNRITRWAPERGARAAANGPRGLAPPQSPLTLPRVCCSPPHRTRAFGSPELSLRDQSHPRPLTASKKTPTQFAAAARHRTPHRTRRGERVDMPLPTSLKFALLLQPRPCRLRHALTFRQGWSSLRRRGSGTAAPRQGPPSSAEALQGKDPATATPKKESPASRVRTPLYALEPV